MKIILSSLLTLLSFISFAQKAELIIKSGHQSEIRSASISPDGRILIVVEEEEAAILWDMKTGRQLRTFKNVLAANFGAENNQIDLVTDAYKFQTVDLNGTVLKEYGNTAVGNNKDNRLTFNYFNNEGFLDVDGFIYDKEKGFIRRISHGSQDYSPKLKLLATSEQSNEISLYDITSGEKQNTFPLKLEPGEDFKYIQISPDGTLLLGGDNYVLNVVDVASKSILRSFSYFEEGDNKTKVHIINASFSPDSKKLAVLTDEFVVLYDVASGKQLWKSAQSKISGDIYGVNHGIAKFSLDGNKILLGGSKNLLTLNAATGKHEIEFVGTVANWLDDQYLVNNDETLIIKSGVQHLLKWNLSSGLMEKAIPIDYTNFFTVNASGNRFYSLPDDTSFLTEFNTSGKEKASFVSTNVRNLDNSLSLSFDGKFIAVGGVYYCATCENTSITKLEVFDAKTYKRIAAKSNLSHGVFAHTSNRLAAINDYEANSPLSFYSFPFITPSLQIALPGGSNGSSNLMFSPNDKYFAIKTANGVMLIELATKRIIKVDLPEGSTSLTNAFSADELYYIVGTDTGDVLFYDINAERVEPSLTIKAHLQAVEGISLTKNGKYLFTNSNEYFIKLWDVKEHTLLATLYPNPKTSDWAVITPDGRFEASAKAQEDMYFVKGLSYFPLSVLYEKLYTPKLLSRLLNGEKLDKVDIDINTIKTAPIVKIQYAEKQRNLNVVDDKIPAYQNTTGLAEITVTASAEDDKIDEIRLFHNGKIVNLATRGLFVTDNVSGNETKKYTLNLLPGANAIRAVALNSQRTESDPDEILVNFANGNTPANVPAKVNANGIIDAVDKNATLHLIVVGINKYQNEKLSLNYALADAKAFKDETELGAKTIISNTKTYFVTDEKANKLGIEKAFKEVQQNAKPQDVLVFYYAGHGVISEKNKEFYLVPTDVADLKNVDETLSQKGIPSKLLQQYAIDIAAQKQVFILDACQSAGAFAQLMTNDANQQKSLAVVARSTGTHWIAASGSQQFANEFSQLGHGAFTYVLLQALKGEAANNKMVTVNGLKNFLQTGVPALMKKYNGSAQYPASYGLGNDFPVEVMK
ncbi:MAG: caspase family protein [Flavobacterium sp.]|nr:caspase family protein [Pedobacter sp.]